MTTFSHSKITPSAASFIILSALFSMQVQGLETRVYSAASHDRFVNFTSTPTHNTSFIYNGYNLTGAGWDSSQVTRGLTMISPIHYVCANHFKPSNNIEFLALDNTLVTRTIDSQAAILNDDDVDSDLLLGKISVALEDSDGISFHPYYNGTYLGSDLIALGSDGTDSTGPRAGDGTITGQTDVEITGINSTRCLYWVYSATLGDDNDAYLEVGDSGSAAFIDSNGVAAIVSTNGAVGTTTTGDTVNYGTLIPYYASKVNASMALDGYHLTKSTPGSTSLSLTRTAPTETIRAGHDFTVSLDIENIRTGGRFANNETADNVKLHNAFSTDTTVTSAEGTDWFDESDASTTKARRAFIDNDTTVSYSMTLNIATAGTTVQDITYYADQFTSITESFDINVIESFTSWGTGLTDTTSTGDDDLDGINNLLEYAFGGSPTTTSQTLSDSTTSILPVYDGDTLTYVQRTDASDRALTYTVMTSTTLEDDWVDASSYITAASPVAIDADLESVTVNITNSDTKRFFRIEVTLDE